MINHIVISESEGSGAKCTQWREDRGVGTECEMWSRNSLSISSSNFISEMKQTALISITVIHYSVALFSYWILSKVVRVLFFFVLRTRLSAEFNWITVKSRWITQDNPPFTCHFFRFPLFISHEQTLSTRWIKTRTFREVPSRIGKTFTDVSEASTADNL